MRKLLYFGALAYLIGAPILFHPLRGTAAALWVIVLALWIFISGVLAAAYFIAGVARKVQRDRSKHPSVPPMFPPGR